MHTYTWKLNGIHVSPTMIIGSYVHRFLKVLERSSSQLRLCKDRLACDARATALAFVLIVTNSLSARRWCCLAFFARFGANRVSLSTNASLNFSAMLTSEVFGKDGVLILAGVNPETSHVFGSISLTKGSSSVILDSASLGTLIPLKPKGEALGFTMMRGHSEDKVSNESSSIFGCEEGQNTTWGKGTENGEKEEKEASSLHFVCYCIYMHLWIMPTFTASFTCFQAQI